MKKLLEQRPSVRRNVMMIVGLCLSLYFSYHMLLGDRSLLRLVMLEHRIESLSVQYDDYHGRRVALEHRVTMLRPGSVDRDLLEERARAVLGYVRPGEQVVIVPN